MVITLEHNLLKLESITTLASYLISKGYKVIAPKKENNLVLFGSIRSGSEISLDHVSANNSIKEFFLPCTEEILLFRFTNKMVEIEDPPDQSQKAVIIGAKPCDTASLPILDKIFHDEFKDGFWFKKRDSTTIISIACTRCDDYCFCTSVGLSPDSKSGSDIMLIERAEAGFFVEGITAKGKRLLEGLSEILDKEEDATLYKNEGAVLASNPSFNGDCNEDIYNSNNKANLNSNNICKTCIPEKKFDFARVKQWLDNNFDDPFWTEFSRQCLGCGVCTFLCPTCHCFDIVDEGNIDKGARLKNWDSCQMKMFTMHTSGHNPRSTQDQRWRQRIMHKFRYYVDKFDSILCVGCGRCSRYCPVDMNISECLSQISNKT